MSTETDITTTLTESIEFYKTSFVTLIISTLIASIGSILMITLPPFTFGMYLMSLKIIRKEKAELSDVFSGFNYFFKSIGFFLVYGFAVMVGMFFFIIPGVILIILLQYAIPLILTENYGIIGSAKKSMQLVKDNLNYSLVLALIIFIINYSGALLPMGWVITLPFTILLTCIAVEKIS